MPLQTPLAAGNGCFFHVDLGRYWLAADVWPVTSSTHTTRLPIPNLPSLTGARVGMQVVVLKTPAPNGFSVSNGVLEVLGR